MAKVARDVMTPDPACCTPSTTLDQVAKMMVQNDCGEIPVIDERGCCAGIISQADVAWAEPLPEVGELVREVSRDMGRESR